MKKSAFLVVLLMTQVGCDSRCARDEQEVRQEAYRVIRELTNQTVRAIAESRGVLTNLSLLAETSERLAVVQAWETALRSIQIDKANPMRRYSSVIEAYRAMNDGVVDALLNLGANDRELWEARLHAVAWLDEQIRRLDPETRPSPQWPREMANLWHCYRGLVWYRENVVENLEIMGFDQLQNSSDRDFVRRLFERQVGRAVRPGAEIVRRGVFAKRRDEELNAREQESLRTFTCPPAAGR